MQEQAPAPAICLLPLIKKCLTKFFSRFVTCGRGISGHLRA